MALRPPQHRVDAPAIFVRTKDPAWDEDRIGREVEEVIKANEAKQAALRKEAEHADKPCPEDDFEADHPVWRYRRGETRFDLHAADTVGGQKVTAAEYLQDGAVEWQLRELTVEEQLAHHDVQQKGGDAQAAGKACKWGLVECRSGEIDVDRSKDGVDDSTLSEIRKRWGIQAVVDIGNAVVRLTAGITANEGKPSGS